MCCWLIANLFLKGKRNIIRLSFEIKFKEKRLLNKGFINTRINSKMAGKFVI